MAFEQLTADFGRGDDMIYCTGWVMSAAGSSVFGGSEGRVNRRTVRDNDQIIIEGDVNSVNLGHASSWTSSDYSN